MLDDYHCQQLIDVADQVVQMVVWCGDLGQLERLPKVAHVKVYLPGVSPLGKDIGSIQEERVMRTQVGVEGFVSCVWW